MDALGLESLPTISPNSRELGYKSLREARFLRITKVLPKYLETFVQTEFFVASHYRDSFA
jgi:hypothetical protein